MKIFNRKKKREALFVLRVPERILLPKSAEDKEANEFYTKLMKNVCAGSDAGIILPSTKYPLEDGGGDMYEVEVIYWYL